MRLENKIAIITGAGSGIGRAMAKRFASEGAHVVCADISGKQEAVAAEIGDAAVPIHTDVANEDDVRKMIAVAEDKFGRLDILVNNAGFGGQMAPLHEQTAESWDRGRRDREYLVGLGPGGLEASQHLWRGEGGCEPADQGRRARLRGQKDSGERSAPRDDVDRACEAVRAVSRTTAGHLQAARNSDGSLGPRERHRLRRAVPGERRSSLRHRRPTAGGRRLLHRVFRHGRGKHRRAERLSRSRKSRARAYHRLSSTNPSMTRLKRG